MNELMSILKQFGPSVTAITFFIWWAYQREKKLTDRINQVEDFVKERLTGLIETTTLAINDNAASNRELTASLSRRPCMKDERFQQR